MAGAEMKPIATPTRSKVITLIPKQLRMDWVDLMSVDPRLSHVAFRAGCIIGKHFSSTTALTFIGLPALARLLNVKSERTAWGAVRELEGHGYLRVIHRRGKGHANEYRIAIDNTQPTATSAAAKLAKRCELLKVQNTQNDDTKHATDCDPTLIDPSGLNPGRADHELGEEGNRLRQRLGGDVFASWFRRLRIERASETGVELSAPSRFIADYVHGHFLDEVQAAFGTDEITIVVRGAQPPSAAARAGPIPAGPEGVGRRGPCDLEPNAGIPDPDPSPVAALSESLNVLNAAPAKGHSP